MNKINRKNPKALLGNLNNEEIDFIEEQGAWQLLVDNEAFFHDAKNEDLLHCLQEKVVYALQCFKSVAVEDFIGRPLLTADEDFHTGQVWWQVQTLYKWRGADA